MRVSPQLSLTMLAHLAVNMSKNLRMNHGFTLPTIKDGVSLKISFRLTTTSRPTVSLPMYLSLWLMVSPMERELVCSNSLYIKWDGKLSAKVSKFTSKNMLGPTQLFMISSHHFRLATIKVILKVIWTLRSGLINGFAQRAQTRSPIKLSLKMEKSSRSNLFRDSPSSETIFSESNLSTLATLMLKTPIKLSKRWIWRLKK